MAIQFEDLSEAEREVLINENKEWWKWREICNWEYNSYYHGQEKINII